MEQMDTPPSSWIGQEVHLQYRLGGDRTTSHNFTLQAVSEYGVTVSAEEHASFFPWSTVVRMDLGPRDKSSRALRIR